MKRCVARKEIVPGPILIPAVSFPFIAVLSLLKYFGNNTSQKKMLPLSGYFLLMLLMTFVELGALSFVFSLAHYVFCQKLPVPPVFINCILVVFSIGLFAGTLYDLESAREYQGILTLSILQTYVFPAPYVSWPLPENYIEGKSAPVGGIEVLLDSIKLHYVHWIILFLIIAALVTTVIFILSTNWSAFTFSLFSRKILISQSRHIFTRVTFQDRDLKVLNSMAAISLKARPAQLAPCVLTEQCSLQPLTSQDVALQIQKAQVRELLPCQHPAETISLKSYPDGDPIVFARQPRFPVKLYDNLFRAPEFLISAACAVCYVVLLLMMLFTKSALPTFLDRGAPASYMFLKQMGPYQTNVFSNKASYGAMVDILRSQYTLSADECWLDQRSIPVYPLLRASHAACCAYNGAVNGIDCAASNSKIRGTDGSEHTLQSEPPNVVILIWESLSISPYFYTDRFLQGDEALLRSANEMLDPTFVPNLQRFVEGGISFINSASLGLPTVSGWHSLMTGLIPNFYGVNMITSAATDVYGLPQFYVDVGYASFYVSPSSFNFDGKDAWVTRPGWFTDIVYYHPTPEQAEWLGLDPETLPDGKYWVADRITNKQFVAEFSDIRKRIPDKPILGIYMNVDTHTPFYGFDKKEFYLDKELDEVTRMCEKESDTPRCRFLLDSYVRKYARVLKYSDSYFLRETIAFLEENHPNTIVAVIGDHGSRTGVSTKQLRKGVSDAWRYSSQCDKAAFLDDSAFNTGAYIRYLGGPGKGNYHKELYQYFQKWKGTVYTGTTDNREVLDFVYLLATRGSKRTMVPTYRLTRDLEAVLQNVSLGLELSPWHSVSVVGLGVEYRTEKTLYRANSMSPSGAIKYENIRGLTCLDINTPNSTKALRTGDTLRSAEERDMYENSISLVQFYSFLLANGQVFHRSFSNTTCIDNYASAGSNEPTCTFPDPERKHISQGMFAVIIGIMILIGLLVGGILSSIAYCWRYTNLKRRLKEDDKQSDIS